MSVFRFPGSSDFQDVRTLADPANRLHGDGLWMFGVLRAGDRVDVEWPDKTVSTHTVQTTITGSDEAGWTSRAFVGVIYHGVEGAMPLYGGRARRSAPLKQEFDSRGRLLAK